MFIGFIEAGIPFSVTIAFLITSPLINEVAVVVFADALGLTLTATYIISGMAVGIIGGFVMEKLKLSRYVEGYVYDIKMGNLETDEEKLSFKQELKIALRYSLSIFKRIWLFVIIGIGLGASIHGFVPQEFFTENLGKDNILSVPLAVLSGIPLYSNATGIVPIAKALIEKGMAIGTVLAMMMSVVAISLPEMIILRQVLKPRLIFFFALYLFIAFVVLGYFYNYIFYLK
ncbi:MAG: putative permease [Alphaproteobacteria bacterium ADurb.Bin438]|nr:MAG: putative permease [Alphaproteobacteria bacterium ADurb.Bin438]